MKVLSLLLWVTQFGFSALLPVCSFMILGSWLQNTCGLGSWVVLLCGAWGILICVPTVRLCYRSMRKQMDDAQSKEHPTAFNDHE